MPRPGRAPKGGAGCRGRAGCPLTNARHVACAAEDGRGRAQLPRAAPGHARAGRLRSTDACQCRCCGRPPPRAGGPCQGMSRGGAAASR
eukprot:5074282-Alexandrium_andersonii.AAC.1